MNVLALLRSVVTDIAQLKNKQLATIIAGGLVAVIAAIAGVKLTVAEVTGWLVLVGTIAAVVEKNIAVKAAAAKRANRR